jgi:imidazolonepropionase-like amidohydrolase
MNRKITTAEVHAYMEPEMFDRIIKAMVAKNIHWSPTWGTTFRALSPRAQQMKQQELTLLNDPGLRYLPPYILKASEQHFAYFENASPEKRTQLISGYAKVQDFARRFIAAGGKVHLGSDPDNILAGWGVHAELQLLVDAGLTAVQAVQSASLNVAQAWGKQKDYGSVEKGKIGIWSSSAATRRKIFLPLKMWKGVYGWEVGRHFFHPDYKNPVPRPIEDRPD